MPEPSKVFFEFFKSANDLLHGTDSRFKMVLFIFLLVLTVTLAIIEIVEKVRERFRKLKEMEEKHPNVFSYLYSAKARSLALSAIVILLLIDWREAVAISPPVVRSPDPPKVEFISRTCAPSVLPHTGAAPAAQPAQSISALMEVRSAIQAVQRTSRDWSQEVRQAHMLVERAQTRLSSATDKAQAQDDLDKAKDAYGIALAGINARLDQSWRPVASQLDLAVAHAIARMKMPGSKQISPNDASSIEEEYHRSLAAIQGPITPEDHRNNRVNLDTFDSVLKFLKSLSERLADYSENPTDNNK